MSLNHFFVAGTGTDVGKTVVSTILAAGMNACYWKPIQTGANEGTDSNAVKKWIGRENIYSEAYVFRDPVSPHLAAEREKQEIDLNRCLERFRLLERSTIIEGAGGLMVPINSSLLIVDLIRSFEVPVIIVSSTRLGTINHTLMSLEVLRHRNVRIAGVIMVGDVHLDTSRAIEKYGNINIIGNIPQCEHFTKQWFLDSYNQLNLEILGGNHVKQFNPTII